jgi:hypothetical protein
MNPYDIVMRNLRDAGFDHDELADRFSREGMNPVHVVNVVRDQKNGKVLFIRHAPGDTVVVFQGFQVVLDRLTLLIDRDVARDWAL